MSAYEGKALVNSVTAEDERLEAILPLVKRHGAAVIALPNNKFEIPEQPERRLNCSQDRRGGNGELWRMAKEDVVLRPLAMPIGADTSLVLRTLRTISLMKEELGMNMVLGASNVSFGMPSRVDRGEFSRHGDSLRTDQCDHGCPARLSSCAP